MRAVPPRALLPLFTLLLLTAWGVRPAPATAQQAISEDEAAAFVPRPIGPAVTGGRVHDVEALPGDPSTLYVATASGGLWKSTNRGHTWTDLWADMPVSTFGDVAIAPSNSDIVYAGTGEQQNRQSTSWGNGVYRSDDGGNTWRHLGLESSRHISRVHVDPTNPDVVWVAALGNLWTSGGERGVYTSSDGGATWTHSLSVDDHTGAIDLVLDPSNPRTAYAAMYQRQRRTWGFNGGGPGSGIYKTTDGGASWSELTNGVPAGDKGRIGLAISQSNPRVLAALIEHPTESGTYRSEDGGTTWRKMSNHNGRPMYYSHIFIDPTDDTRIYTAATNTSMSEDGGATWSNISARPTYDVGMHADMHTMWINPSDPEHFYLAGDAGLHETYDRGQSYRKINNFPVGQFYAIGVDMQDPYWVYGGMQDNHSWMGPSETRSWIGILNDDWMQTGFGDGMYQQADPTSARYVYIAAQNGGHTRVDAHTGDILSIRPVGPEGERLRWDWTSPSLVSRHNPATVYVGANRLFTSHNRGESWTYSDDLTRQIDRDDLEIMGVAGRDISLSRNDGTSSFGEITTIAESPLSPSILWVGTDDGNVQVSTDGGETFTEVSGNVEGLPGGTYVSRVAASGSAAGTAYATFDAHRDGDFAPYVFRTEDFGQTWTALHSGLPSGSVNALVEHPGHPNTLYVGTEHHLFVSTDRGGQWAKLPIPTTSFDDLVVHPREHDLVIGTHGRSIWILDDARALGEFGDAPSTPAHVFSIGQGTLKSYRKDTSYRGQAEFHGTNPRDGVEISYKLAAGGGDARLVIENGNGDVVRELIVPSDAGVHRINWDLRWSMTGDADRWQELDTSVLPRSTASRGPFVSPGTYTVSLQARGTSSSTTVDVRGDPEFDLTDDQYRSREAFLVELLALQRSIRESAGAGPGQGCRGLSGDMGEACQVLARVYGSVNGQGIRPGSMYGPTVQDRALVRQALERIGR